MSDLIERLRGGVPATAQIFRGLTFDMRATVYLLSEAATALAEAEATIARQQVMLDRALEDNGGMMAEIARLRGLLIEERTETLWNAYHTGHEKDGMWDHCCMSDGEWLAAECGLPPSQRVYSAEAIKTAIPVAARRAALSRPHATKEETG